MKNKLSAILIFSCILAIFNQAKAQQSSVSFNKQGVSLIFKIESSSPDAKKQSFGSVYFTGYDENEKQSRVHRILTDRESGTYFGYDLIVESADAPGKFKISFKPLSIDPPVHLIKLNDLKAGSLPKYPEAMTVEDGDTIALDILYNPQTKVKIADLIKVTTKKPQSSDFSLFTTTASGGGFNSKPGFENFGTSSGSGSNEGLFSKKSSRDFSLDDVKLRLTSPKLLVGGTVSTIQGSEWSGVIEGSVIFLYIPGKGRFIFSIFPRDDFNFRKDAALENNKIIFQSNNERYEIVSEAPIISSGGDWNLWILNDPNYKPDLTFGSVSADHLQYGASNQVDYLLTRKRRTNPSNTNERDAKGFYQKWINDDVHYLITEKEKQGFTELKTNEEFEQFIHEFWKRRDATPETTENEFRREYYERIAYANQNFAFGKTAGLLSDRGRIYITHGKPDEIKKTAKGEIWIYKNLPGRAEGDKFEFADAEGKGEFRLRQ
jgi:GWxTD domain-containing protein